MIVELILLLIFIGLAARGAAAIVTDILGLEDSE